MKDLLPLVETPWPLLLLTPLFFLFFIGVFVWVYRSGSREKYESIGKIPLDEQDSITEQK